ncbi:hypothetical protein PoB_001120300 [Plakobranchus ocellatus]|uniref:CUB domain-containing protein n=1 Tax=Plakobranchus ocellatus TaxID=259542 RepID=A0AAV3YR01_9GAST|nr:hypothetical protein PoB_001120300 [Plakobranchus ocellatus]
MELTFLALSFVLCIHQVSSSVLNDLLLNENFKSNELFLCNKTQTEDRGSVFMKDVEQINGPQCILHIDVPNASSIRILFLPLSPRQKTTSSPSAFGVRFRPRILVYKSHPKILSLSPFFDWEFSTRVTVQEFHSSKVWLVYKPLQTSVNEHKLNQKIYISISYVANFDVKKNLQCADSGPEAVNHGTFHIYNRMLGDAAVLRCNDGYVIPNGFESFSHCIFDEGSRTLTWSKSNFLCESVCKHPPEVDHSSVNRWSDTDTLYMDHVTEPGKQNQTKFTAQYTCKPPYIMHPANHPGIMTCTSNEQTFLSAIVAVAATTIAPMWLPKLPSCVIPDCFSTTILNQRQGAVVNPSYPSNLLTGGRRHCRWEVLAPRKNIFIHISTLYIDLPASDNSTKVEIFDIGHARPIKILVLSGHTVGLPHVISESSKVLITYTGPVENVTGLRGFYLKYEMRPKGLRFRRASESRGTADLQGSGSSASGADEETSVSNEVAAAAQNTTPRNFYSTVKGNSEDSPDNGLIAVFVIIPLVVLILILVGGYFWYRRKYPVRMILGRDVSKFTNPKYARPNREATLVRNDADKFFSEPHDDTDGICSLEMNPENPRYEQYDNPGYQADETDEMGVSVDDEEEERQFRAKKSWLFRRSEDKGIDGKARGRASKGDSFSDNQSHDDVSLEKINESVTVKEDDRKRSASRDSVASDISRLMKEQSVTPKHPRRGVSNDQTTESSSTTGSVVSSHSVNIHSEVNKSEANSRSDLTESIEEEKIEKIAQNVEVKSEDEESNFMKTAKVIFEQPSLEQVMAVAKARSRSMSAGNIKLDLHARQRSYSVDPTKSARKTSLHDETILAAYAKSLAGRQILEAPISSASSQHSMDTGPELSIYSKSSPSKQPTLSASIVGVDIKVRTASDVSSGSSFSVRSVDGSNGADRRRGLSLASTNSNPHLVTDLDDTSQESADDAATEEKIDASDLQSEENQSNAEEPQTEEDANVKSFVESSPSDQEVMEPSKEEYAFKIPEEGKNATSNNVNGGVSSSENLSEPVHNTSVNVTEESRRHLSNEDEDSSENNGLAFEEVVSGHSQHLAEQKRTSDDNSFPGASLSADESLAFVVTQGEPEKDIQTIEQVGTVLHHEDDLTNKENDAAEMTEGSESADSELFRTKNTQQSDLSAQPDNSNEFVKDRQKEKLEDESSGVMPEEKTSQVTGSSEDGSDQEGDVPKRSDTNLKHSNSSSSGEEVTELNNLVKDKESTDDSDSDSSESGASGVAATYDFGGGDSDEHADEVSKSESESEGGSDSKSDDDSEEKQDEETDPGDAGIAGPDRLASLHHTKASPRDSSITDSSQSQGSNSDTDNHLQSTSTATHNIQLGLDTSTSQKRVKILPLAINLSDDDDEDDDDKGDKYRLSDDEISDILNSSDDENDTGKSTFDDASIALQPSRSSPATYTFQSYDSDDEDIDV